MGRAPTVSRPGPVALGIHHDDPRGESISRLKPTNRSRATRRPLRRLGCVWADGDAHRAARARRRRSPRSPPSQNSAMWWCHILSAILTEATGSSARDFAQAELFGPLDEEAGPWLTDSRGYCFGGQGLARRGRTMIKLGRLFLDGGTSEGRLVVSEHWVREPTTWRRGTGEAVPWGSGYGSLWWMGEDARTGLTFQFAVGYGGQFIFLVPERDTTIAAATE